MVDGAGGKKTHARMKIKLNCFLNERLKTRNCCFEMHSQHTHRKNGSKRERKSVGLKYRGMAATERKNQNGLSDSSIRRRNRIEKDSIEAKRGTK